MICTTQQITSIAQRESPHIDQCRQSNFDIDFRKEMKYLYQNFKSS